MTVGLGSGSTSSLAIERLGEKVRDGLNIRAVASSLKSETLARELSIVVVDPSEAGVIDIAIDGADEVDKNGNLVKGGGGSLLREKIIAYASKRFHVMVDQSKLVERLGQFPLPVEIAMFAVTYTLRHLRDLGCEPVLRMSAGQPFITDNGNYIADCNFKEISDPPWLDVRLKMIPGVVETGLFPNRIITSILIGYSNGDVKEVGGVS
jgi:ribose 5-phosphate isomerase A